MENSIPTETSSEQQEDPKRAASLPRNRNPRGEGNKLRDDIIEAARRLLEREGSADSVTLRAVAREIGIAAPSIYRHFLDRDAIVRAVEELTYQDLEERIIGQRDLSVDPVERLVAGCLAYVDFALENPGRYRILFNQLEGAPDPEAVALIKPEDVVGLSTFQILVDGVIDCVALGRSTSTDPFGDSANIWASLHGAVTLRTTATLFPWNPLEETIREVIYALGHISETHIAL